MLGTVVIAGNTYQVTKVTLHDGMFHIIAHGHGPYPAVTDEVVTIYGADGQGICQSWHITMPAIAKHMTVDITLPIQIATMEAEPGPTEVIIRLVTRK